MHLWANEFARIASGLSVLLLLGVQEKVCPWMLSEPADAAVQQALATDKAAPTHKDSERPPEEKKPVFLGNALPDVISPRRSAPASTTALQAGVPEQRGAVACGSRVPPRLVPSRPDAAEPGRPYSLLPPAPAADGVLAIARAAGPAPRDPAVGLSISEIGPPIISRMPAR